MASLIILLDIVHTRRWKPVRLVQKCIEYRKLHTKSSIIQTCQNDLGFSLYTIPSVCYMITILENWTESKVRVSADINVLLLNIRNWI